jgi:hypothetical protein
MWAPAGSEREEWGGGSGPAAGLVGSKRRWADGKGKKKERGRRVAGLGREEREKEFKEVFSFFSKLFFLNLFNFSNF